MILMSQSLILFDGDCSYCNGWVNWIRKHDTSHKFRFAPLDSDEGREQITQFKIPKAIDSVVLVDDQMAYIRSDAAWRILHALPGSSIWGSMLSIVPRPLRNWGYDLVANNRHRLGSKDACELP